MVVVVEVVEINTSLRLHKWKYYRLQLCVKKGRRESVVQPNTKHVYLEESSAEFKESYF